MSTLGQTIFTNEDSWIFLAAFDHPVARERTCWTVTRVILRFVLQRKSISIQTLQIIISSVTCLFHTARHIYISLFNYSSNEFCCTIKRTDSDLLSVNLVCLIRTYPFGQLVIPYPSPDCRYCHSRWAVVIRSKICDRRRQWCWLSLVDHWMIGVKVRIDMTLLCMLTHLC